MPSTDGRLSHSTGAVTGKGLSIGGGNLDAPGQTKELSQSYLIHQTLRAGCQVGSGCDLCPVLDFQRLLVLSADTASSWDRAFLSPFKCTSLPMFNTHGAVPLSEQLSLKRLNVYYFSVEVNTLLKVSTLLDMIFFSLSHDDQQCSQMGCAVQLSSRE